jgi:dihydroflavonol-4-reductase
VKLLITGGTGLLGNNLIRLALARGDTITTLCRSSAEDPSFRGLDVRVCSIDIADAASVEKVFSEGFDAVVHCAAHIHLGWTRRDEGMRINRDGTRNLLTSSLRCNAKFIHVSTVNTLAIGVSNSPADETTLGDGQVPCTYVVTKRAAEHEAMQAAERGQDISIVHPGFMLGPWDWKPSSGRMVQALKGFAPFAPTGGCSVCDPRDVGQAILNAIESGQRARHYILAGENITYLELWRRIANQFGKRGPQITMKAPAKVLGSFFGDLAARITRREGDINSAAIRMSEQFHWYRSDRAIQELGYRFRPADESIRDSVSWLREHHFV